MTHFCGSVFPLSRETREDAYIRAALRTYVFRSLRSISFAKNLAIATRDLRDGQAYCTRACVTITDGAVERRVEFGGFGTSYRSTFSFVTPFSLYAVRQCRLKLQIRQFQKGSTRPQRHPCHKREAIGTPVASVNTWMSVQNSRVHAR